MAKIVLDETAHAEKLAITGTPGIPENADHTNFATQGHAFGKFLAYLLHQSKISR